MVPKPFSPSRQPGGATLALLQTSSQERELIGCPQNVPLIYT
jgi:hypothetical protein